ncbi:MAG TPA: molecular chaperone [Sphingomonadaceae bacterium]|nr:molecular chaperone [Sphingomonadaceae bacterium]
MSFGKLTILLKRSAAIGLMAAGLLASAPAAAQGDLLVAPTRVIMDGRGTANVILSNIGNEEATYRISAELRRMTPEGDLEQVEADEINSTESAALEMVRFAPRRVVLPPGQPQSVRLSARPASDLPDGEYRIHLTFNGIPKVLPVSAAASERAAQGIEISLIPIYAISIPIIVRKGNVDASALISNPRLEPRPDGGAFLKLDMARSGNGSVFGELRVLRPGESEPIFHVRGIAIYPEIASRELALSLTSQQAAEFRGNLRFEYRELPETGGELLASVEGMIG